ncbi:hypothetical protein MKW92_021713 [Papaver armeniacum]|nr:hypothetical protein MKW92_021713 [Papaver armeniacum]
MGKINGAGSLLSPQNLQWVCVIASAVLIIASGTSIQKSFLGENGVWAVFLALAFKLFYIFPKELELPLYAMLFVIASPQQVVKLRGTQTGSVISLLIAGFLAFQHFSGIGFGNLLKGFQPGSLLATVGIIGITLTPLMLLIGSKL